MGQEGVPQALASMGSLHQAGDVHHAEECWDLAANQEVTTIKTWTGILFRCLQPNLTALEWNPSRPFIQNEFLSNTCWCVHCNLTVGTLSIAVGLVGGKNTKILTKLNLKKSWNKPKSVPCKLARQWQNHNYCVDRSGAIRQPCLTCCLLEYLFLFGREKVKKRQKALLRFMAKTGAKVLGRKHAMKCSVFWCSTC